MSRLKMTRRQLLGAAATTAVAGVVLAREASVFGAGVAPAPRISVFENRAGQRALLDGMLSGDDLAQARATLAPLQARTLEPDLLWQWRRGLGQELAQGTRAIAITRWDKAFLLSGLAREAMLPVRQRRIGRSLFQTEIG